MDGRFLVGTSTYVYHRGLWLSEYAGIVSACEGGVDSQRRASRRADRNGRKVDGVARIVEKASRKTRIRSVLGIRLSAIYAKKLDGKGRREDRRRAGARALVRARARARARGLRTLLTGVPGTDILTSGRNAPR